jgi:phage terminase Nu1 subunit (DNA packaging protein)
MGKLVSQIELSEIVGASRQALLRWGKEGMPFQSPPAGEKGNIYDTAEVIRWMIGRRSNPDGEVIDGVYEKARLDRERADAQALKNAVDRGDLVPLTAVVEAVTGVYVTLRSRLLGLPTALAPLLIGHTKLPIIERVITDEITECLVDVTGGNAQALARGAAAYSTAGEIDGGGP